MLTKLFAHHAFFIAMVLASFFTCPLAEAATRAVLIPGRSAILIMEGFTASGGADLDPRHLFDAIAVAPVKQQGGEGKIVSIDKKAFNLTCATKNSTANSVVCNITVNNSPNAKIAFTQAEYHVEGAPAQDAFTKLAGTKAARFDFETSDHTLKISSTPEKLDFFFHY